MLPELRLTTDVRHNLFLAVKEALNNVARHSKASEASVQLKAENNAVVIRGRAVGELFLAGRGAGSMPTAAAVLSDVVELAQLRASSMRALMRSA